MDEDYKIFEGVPHPMVENLAWAQADNNRQKEVNDLMRSGAGNNPGNPNTQLPLGDGVIPLMVMAILYAGWIGWKKRKPHSTKTL